jgi:glycopeptide antibiotics resistance protein
VVFVVTVGATLAATTTTELPYYSVEGIALYLREFAHPTNLLAGFASTDERLANIGLLIPLGSVTTLLWRRPIAVVCALALLSFVIEGWQGFIGRGGDAVDVVHNEPFRVTICDVV